MPVTKTAKRALRGSAKKGLINKLILTKLDSAIRQAKKSKAAAKIIQVVSLADRAAKKGVIHKNKAARIKSQMASIMPKVKSPSKKASSAKKK